MVATTWWILVRQNAAHSPNFFPAKLSCYAVALYCMHGDIATCRMDMVLMQLFMYYSGSL